MQDFTNIDLNLDGEVYECSFDFEPAQKQGLSQEGLSAWADIYHISGYDVITINIDVLEELERLAVEYATT